jgi:hypothetical protein
MPAWGGRKQCPASRISAKKELLKFVVTEPVMRAS